MKIVYIENVRIPSRRAHAIQILHTCQELGYLGHELVLVTPKREGMGRYQDIFLDRALSFSHVVLSSVDFLAFSWLPKKIAYYLQRLSFMRACCRWKSGRQADVWYTRDLYVVWALSCSGETWVVELHDAPHPLLWEKVRARIKKYVVITSALKQWLIERGVADDDVVVAHDGWDPASLSYAFDREMVRRDLGWRSTDVIFVYAGGLFAWKGVDRIVQWWNERPPARAKLVILGGAKEDRARISSLIKIPSIHLLETVSPIEVSHFLRAADVGVLPTSPDHVIGRLYTSPLKLFEYLSSGLPVLASDVPSSREVLDDSVARFFFDASSFEEACQELVSRDAWRRGASEQARQKSSLYTWSARAKKIDILFTTLS